MDSGDEPEAAPNADRDLIERHVQRVVIEAQEIEIHLAEENAEVSGNRGDPRHAPDGKDGSPVLRLAWTGINGAAVKGIVHSPSARVTMNPAAREQLLSAIAKARAWIGELADGRAASFAEIAEREGKAERHIRFLAPLAFVAPRIVAAIADGSLSSDINVTKMVKMVDCSWTEQERRLCGGA
jgi:hypothetical protein